jgi:putative methionine-R-sulfoxide reductase with GAF domain/HAMP domain-containing protein
MVDSDNVPLQRPKSTLGRKLSLRLLPLVLIPILVMGSTAYLRTRDILTEQAGQQLVSAAQGQLSTILNWAQLREQRLQLGTTRSELRSPLVSMLEGSTSPSFQNQARTQLEDLQTQQGVVLFSEVLLVSASDGIVLASTNEEWEGHGITSELIMTDALQTAPVYDDSLLSPAKLSLLTISPLRAMEGSAVDSLLIGVNSDLRLATLMEEIQAFWEQRGIYRVERGGTFLAFAPDVIAQLPRYASAVESQAMADHPVFALAATNPSDTAQYTSLDGTAVLGAYEWIPEWGMGVVVELPQIEVFAELNALAPFTAVLVGSAAILTVILVGLSTNRLLRPLTDLVRFSGRLARGEWEHRVPEDRDDELGQLAGAFNRMAIDLSGVYQSLEDRVEARTQQIRTAAEVARAVTSIPTLNDLLRRAVDLIKERFAYYHASIFLLDDVSQYAILRESTGEIGEALKARGHQLEVGSQSVIGWVTENNAPRVVTDVQEDPLHFKNELLPETRSEAAVPLQVGGRVLGALDVQSTDPNAFQPEDLEVLQTLADQLSAAIQNARLAQTSSEAADRARLISEVTTQLSGQLDMERVLQTTAQALHNSLGGPEIVIKLAADGVSTPETQAGD